MRILVTNDDGIDAPGLAILEEAARSISNDVWVVAPATEQSGQSQALTLADPLRIAQVGERRYAVDGTPADCVTMALHVAMGRAPDLVLSGINQGFNVADDMPYSGTVGAAMHAASVGIRAIAFSQAYGRLGQEDEEDIWDASRVHCAGTLRALLAVEQPQGTALNVNFPPVSADEVGGLAVVSQGMRSVQDVYVDDRIDARGNPYYWVRFRREAGEAAAETDLGALAAHRISVTPVHADMTDTAALASLAAALAR